MSAKTTINDICAHTGLSLGTVSKYLNGGSVKDANRIKLDEAVTCLHYSVDEYARSFVTGKTNTVGILLPDLDNAFYARIVSGIGRELDRHGYSVIVRDSGYDLDKELKSILWFVSRRVDALIVVPSGRTKEEYAVLLNVDIPVIFLDMWIKDLNVDFIVVNNCDISKEAVRYLISMGHTKIALLCQKSNVYTAHRRVKGYRDAFAEAGIAVDEENIYAVNADTESAYVAAKEILHKGTCTALYASNYTSTFGAVFALNELGTNVPQDISFLGFDDVLITRLYRRKPAIINQPIAEISTIAAERVLELTAQNPPYAYKKNYLRCSFVVGETVKDCRND